MQSTRTNPHRIERQVRVDARWKIIQEVNKHLMRQRAPVFQAVPVPDKEHFKRTGRRTKLVITSYFRQPNLIGMNNLHRAVFIARRFQLVDNLTLQRAGFNVR